MLFSRDCYLHVAPSSVQVRERWHFFLRCNVCVLDYHAIITLMTWHSDLSRTGHIELTHIGQTHGRVFFLYRALGSFRWSFIALDYWVSLMSMAPL